MNSSFRFCVQCSDAKICFDRTHLDWFSICSIACLHASHKMISLRFMTALNMQSLRKWNAISHITHQIHTSMHHIRIQCIHLKFEMVNYICCARAWIEIEFLKKNYYHSIGFCYSHHKIYSSSWIMNLHESWNLFIFHSFFFFSFFTSKVFYVRAPAQYVAPSGIGTIKLTYTGESSQPTTTIQYAATAPKVSAHTKFVHDIEYSHIAKFVLIQFAYTLPSNPYQMAYATQPNPYTYAPLSLASPYTTSGYASPNVYGNGPISATSLQQGQLIPYTTAANGGLYLSPANLQQFGFSLPQSLSPSATVQPLTAYTTATSVVPSVSKFGSNVVTPTASAYYAAAPASQTYQQSPSFRKFCTYTYMLIITIIIIYQKLILISFCICSFLRKCGGLTVKLWPGKILCRSIIYTSVSFSCSTNNIYNISICLCSTNRIIST